MNQSSESIRRGAADAADAAGAVEAAGAADNPESASTEPSVATRELAAIREDEHLESLDAVDAESSLDAREAYGHDRPDSVPLFAIGPWLWGSLAACLAAVLALTGAALLFFYEPTAKGALVSLVELREATSLGFLRDLHLWASHALLVAGWLHLLRVFALGSYRRTVGWSATVGLWLVAIAMAWTGSSLAAGGDDGRALLHAWVAHCVLLPLVAVATIGLWIRFRSAS